MKNSMLKYFPIFKELLHPLLNLPTPINISLFWKIGSILGLSLLIQIISGFFLSMHYNPSTMHAFSSIIHICQDTNYGWLIRFIHLNGASLFFIFMYIHIGRGIYYGSFNLFSVWLIGTLIFIISMTTAFLGYVLPWGQMSFWGATVITNLLSTLPYIGPSLTYWIWGGFSVSNPTLNRFYSIHFILPFVIMLMIFFHLMFLHYSGSSNPLGINSNFVKISFYPYFFLKDLMCYFFIISLFSFSILLYPNILNDPENFIKANSMITPIHIQPEWYFLFAYSILRAIPNKLGGVIALMLSIIIILIPSLINYSKFLNLSYYPLNQFMFWLFCNLMILLTWTGMCPVNHPFIMISQVLTFLYFSYFFINSLIIILWNKLIFN